LPSFSICTAKYAVFPPSPNSNPIRPFFLLVKEGFAEIFGVCGRGFFGGNDAIPDTAALVDRVVGGSDPPLLQIFRDKGELRRED
jgi:hypothetical protein